MFRGKILLTWLGLSIVPAACGAAGTISSITQRGFEIRGIVTEPDGANLAGAKVVACSVPYQDCATKVEAPLTRLQDGLFSYVLQTPGPGPWQVVAWKDSDGDGDASPGDWVGVARDGAGILAPATVLRIGMKQVEGDQRQARASNSDIPKIAGAWSQSSSTQELVLTPKIKLQPSIATGYGTNLGGTFGPGSATNTTIVTESTPMLIRRFMNLEISPDGAFRWKINKVQPDGSGCTKTIDQLKEGRITTSAGSITFKIQGGTDGWRSSCGKSGQSAMRASSETYSYSVVAGALVIKGSGGVNWIFRRN